MYESSVIRSNAEVVWACLRLVLRKKKKGIKFIMSHSLRSDDGISAEGPKKFREHVLSLCGYGTSLLQICTKNLR